MKVCIIRNAEAESNSDVIRSVDAFHNLNVECMILTRSRSKTNYKNKIIQKKFKYKSKEINNFEIQLYGEMDKGLKNLTQLFIYQYKVFLWLLKNKNEYDVIHAYDLDAGLPSILIKLLLRKKVVYHISDLFVDSRNGIPDILKNLVRNVEYYIIKKANDTIICTEQRVEQIKGSKPQRLHILHNSPVECCRLERNLKMSNSEKIKIGYVGGLIDIRFIEEILDVVSINEKIILEVGGIGPMANIVEEYSRRYKNIIYRGKLSYDEALKLYNGCDLMIAIYDPKIKNHKYSAPNKVYEAMMLGKPIIVAKNTGVDMIVEKEEVGLAIEYCKNDFKKTLDNILLEKNILNQLSKNSSEAYNKYSWENMILKYKEIYDSL
ncbi:glycosyltransferase [Paraclostridium bifermentans]|uniref:glycosyltransferase n=1 Tax=Paraclostridium bifermentans TaxID=1490 RepID=UPI00387B3B63